jgi:hypothetical protein
VAASADPREEWMMTVSPVLATSIQAPTLAMGLMILEISP